MSQLTTGDGWQLVNAVGLREDREVLRELKRWRFDDNERMAQAPRSDEEKMSLRNLSLNVVE